MAQQQSARNGSVNLWRYVAGALVGLFIFSLGVQYGRGDFGNFRLSTQNSQLGSLDYDSVNEVYDILRQNFDGKLEEDKMLEGLKQGLARSTGDPFTEYLNVEEAKSFDEDLSGTFSGVGAELSKDVDSNSIIVISPLAGFPAEKAGLRAQDVIAEIDGKPAYDLTVSEAVKLIRGPKGSKVTLKVIRDQQTVTIEIIRDEIKIPSVESKVLEGNIGYMKISRFAEDTAGLSKKAAADFKSANVKGVVLDMRGNPGGLLDSSVSVSSLWLKDKTVLTERRGGKVIKTFTSESSAPLEGVPTVALIDEGSASASEIVAGALRDNKAATLIGKKSFGKGSVQQLERLRDGGILKVTVARWFTPDGKNIDKEGIEPAQKVERTEDDFKNGRDPQLQAAQDYLKK